VHKNLIHVQILEKILEIATTNCQTRGTANFFLKTEEHKKIDTDKFERSDLSPFLPPCMASKNLS
jgi:hypothetical protein